ncbi:MAG TPA: response regulator [Blastocatellia bacterium]|nr:response regulator [Blastocatellia bacterium]
MQVATEEPVEANQRTLNVLVVDDDPFIRATITMALKGTKYLVRPAASAEEAVSIIETWRPDILMTDAMMPGPSGFVLIETIKSHPSCSEIPVILVTCLENADGTVRDATGKADLALSKPFTASQIRESVQSAANMITQREFLARFDNEFDGAEEIGTP